MKKVIGIISWFPNKQPDRQQRIDRLERLLTQLNDMWPDLPIMIVAQNWQGYEVQSVPQDKLTINRYVELGILGARKKLRKNFLASDFDYLIMFDDDAIIYYDNEDLPQMYLSEIDNHPNGFCFIKTKNPSTPYNPYADSQLNLCAISRYIYQQVDVPDLDPQKSEGFEDRVLSYLLHIKFSEYEFDAPEGIKCIHFRNKEEPVPSTWSQREHHDWKHLVSNTLRIERFILENKRLPSNLKG